MKKKLFANRRAFALVLVLIAIVLSTTMAVFFLSSVGRERLGVSLYSTGGEVRHLAGMTVSRVIGQITAATKEGTAKDPVSWASQPGMIRTYDDTGAPKNVYKLYSWDNSTQAGGSFDPTSASQIPAQTWRDDTAHYVDINQKVSDVYPIVDPRAEGVVDGFSVDEDNAIVGGSNLENAPMPVKWLYVLEDGQMVAPTGTLTGTTATVPGATKDNPIIGRVAYWTDDETSKVNINTASEGNFWDVPRSGSRDDVQFAGNPPVNSEFQRIPGHPAMTSLSAVFPELVTENTSDPTKTRWGGSYVSQAQKIYAMSPRIEWGKAGEGSQGGRFPITTYAYDYGPARNAIPLNTLPKKITLDTERLYTIADDFWFKPDRVPNTALEEILDPDDYRRRLFFLTANSRAPETTLFETPRISLWPITWPNASSYFPYRVALTPSLPLAYKAPAPQDPDDTKIVDINPKWITAQERLLAVCASLNLLNSSGGDRYFFQRKDPDSPINDWLNIDRNRNLVTHMTGQMKKPVPGFGGTLETSWGDAPTTSWIALNVFDYVRSFVNQYTAPDALEGIRYSFTGVSFRRGRIGGLAVGGAVGTEEPNAKMPVPIRATIDGEEHRGVGAYPALEEVAVAFYAVEREEPVPPALPSGVTDPEDPAYPEWRNPYNWTNLINLDSSNGYPQVGARTTKMRAVMLLDFTGLEPGVSIRPTFWVKVKGPSFRVNDLPIGLPNGGGGFSAQVTLDTRVTYSASVTPLFYSESGIVKAKIFNNSQTGANVWQLVSNDIVVNPNSLSFEFIGSEVDVEIYACDPSDVDKDPTDDEDRLVYSKTMRFTEWGNPATPRVLPMPMAPRWSMVNRAYRFGNDGSTLAAPSGVLPGGNRAKTSPLPPLPVVPTAKANMLNFSRTTGSDLWQPNPAYQTFPNATATNTTWAWSEYAPTLNVGRTALNQYMPEERSDTSIYQARPNRSILTTYSYRTSNQAGWYPDITKDIDDQRESIAASAGKSEFLRNFSTNFRKRVEALDQRNGRNRTAFCVEGYTAVTPTDHTDLNGISGDITKDLFMQTTDAALQDSLPLLTPYDTVISMVNAPSGGNEDRDPRIAQVSGNDDYQRISNVLTSMNPVAVISSIHPRTTIRSQWHGFGTPGIVPNVTGYQTLPTFRGKSFARSGTGAPGDAGGNLGGSGGLGGFLGAEVGSRNKLPDAGDWTSLPGRYPDGGRLIRPDQEYAQLYQDTSGGMYVPYWPRITYGDFVGIADGVTLSEELSYFSPNRQIPSPVILGSLPSSRTTGWQTLAFCPNTANNSHPGLRSVTNRAPDHLLLDYFWMPVAEPYPISEQFSTAGKVNLNYRIMPFSYITRKTALHAAMKNTWITALTENDNNVANYKSHQLMRGQPGSTTRYAIDVAETLLGFDAVFDGNDLFRSASQICEKYLVPKGQTLAAILNFWTTNRLTSDNAREQPYNDLYSRVTTKSNTYTVHWRVQVLRKVPATAAGGWDETRDRVASELRGSTLIERYIDSNSTGIPDYATATDPEPLSGFYKWRVVAENYFQP
jgi:hypothetical protein